MVTSSSPADRVLVIAPLAVALGALAIVSADPRWFVTLLVLDLWLLGYHHVIATYLRLGLDADTRRRSIALWFLLPLMLGVVWAVAETVGVWVVVSVYFYWQWYHYAKQSWGVLLTLGLRCADARRPDRLDIAAFWALPLAGVAWRSAEQPPLFLGFELWAIPLPPAISMTGLVVAVVVTAIWLTREFRSCGIRWPLHRLYLAAHSAIFFLGYIATDNIDHGWLAVNIWHNLQYLLFVRGFHVRRYTGGVESDSLLISWTSQPGAVRAATYWIMTGTLTLAIYGAAHQLAYVLPVTGLAGLVIVFQAINFHHYVADSRIWKLRRKPLRSVLEQS